MTSRQDSTPGTAGSGGAPQGAVVPVGQWPEPTPRWGLAVAALLWVAWLGFLIWMMILRVQTE